MNYLGITALFFWISFFAPWASAREGFKFIILPGVLLLAAFWFKEGFRKLIFNKAEIPFFIFLLTMAGGFAGAKDQAVAHRHFWMFIFPVPFIYLFAKAAFKEDYARLVMRSVCLMAALVCVFGIIEFLIKQNFIYAYFVKNAYFETFIGKRMMSTQIHPVPLGTYLSAVLPLAVALVFLEEKVFLKALAKVYAVLIFTGIILSFSRGGFLSFFAAMFVMVIYLARWKKAVYLWVLILLSGITIGVCASYFSVKRHSRSTVPYRIERIMAAGDILKDKLFLGLGFGNFRICFNHYLPRLAHYSYEETKVADCMYVTILTETGIAGFSGFLLFIFFIFKRVRDKLNIVPSGKEKFLLVSFLAGFIAILCSFLTYDGLYWVAPAYLFWSYAGILSFLSFPK